MRIPALIISITLLLAACGVPREAADLATRQSTLIIPNDGDAIRTALLTQEPAWSRLDALMQQRVFGGISVNPDFTAAVHQAAALARRQRQLIEQHQDDPQTNRQALERFTHLWNIAAQYLAP